MSAERVIKERYIIPDRHIAEGAFGKVYIAQDKAEPLIK